MLTSTYVVGEGYLVRDGRGRVVAKGLNVRQRDALLAQQDRCVLDLSVIKLYG